jgi:hypothetical protein
MIQFILLALFYAGLGYLGIGLIGLAFLSLREEKNWLKNEPVQRLLPGKVKPEVGPLVDEIVREPGLDRCVQNHVSKIQTATTNAGTRSKAA